MIGLYQTIRGDLFGIARRLKAIDKGYFVVYSYRDNRYEVHNSGNKGNTFCFAAQKLDGRVLVKARQTRRERIDRLLKEMEKDNQRKKCDILSQTVKRIEMEAEQVLSKGGR